MIFLLLRSHLVKVLHNAWGMFKTFLRYKLEEWGKKHHVGQKPIPDAIMPRLCQYNKRKSKFPRKHHVYTEMVIRCQME
ncbi:hypothetical protein CWD94_02345 [Lysinibacillus xylanilyticus]|uniref:Uncharacterized protein n=1 Tax=Lysinibacillus xylanilyticus TaxID=582475 RepID=A0A2M9QAZ3_9BACI|nr:hypothetical protein CWD94_02345 [Lysinibacillus xylanilyticus]